MENWESVFRSYLNSGVFVISPHTENGAVRKAAEACNLAFISISLRGISAKDTFLKKLAQALSFPGYFGLNWDALSDSLTDLSWKPAAGYVILVTRFQPLSDSLPEEIPLIKNIFESSAAYWKENKVPFFVILS
jgi:hypothetical protein